jgi:hypothetical protein
LEAAQWSKGSAAAASLAQMTARSAGGSPALAVLVRERQDLVGEWQAKDKQLIAARGEPPGRRNAANEKALCDRLGAIDARLTEIDRRFARDFPEYAALASPKPVPGADVQADLRDDEALVLFLDTDAGFKPLAEETFLFVVTRTAGARFSVCLTKSVRISQAVSPSSIPVSIKINFGYSAARRKCRGSFAPSFDPNRSVLRQSLPCCRSWRGPDS